MGRMEIQAILADAVQASGGKLHALGVGWRVLQATSFPARHDRIGMGVIVRTTPAEAGNHRLTIGLSGPAGPIAFGRETDGTPRATVDAGFATPPGEGSATLALNLDGLVFEHEGDHAFVLAIDGQERVRLPFRVQTKAEPPSSEVRTGVYL
jgi:hypothetical protein